MTTVTLLDSGMAFVRPSGKVHARNIGQAITFCERAIPPGYWTLDSRTQPAARLCKGCLKILRFFSQHTVGAEQARRVRIEEREGDA